MTYLQSITLLDTSQVDVLTLSTVTRIWELADTTSSGDFYFPEFALAMPLCSLVLDEEPLPSQIPEAIKDEVSSMIESIKSSASVRTEPMDPTTTAQWSTIRSRDLTSETLFRATVTSPEEAFSSAPSLSTINPELRASAESASGNFDTLNLNPTAQWSTIRSQDLTSRIDSKVPTAINKHSRSEVLKSS